MECQTKDEDHRYHDGRYRQPYENFGGVDRDIRASGHGPSSGPGSGALNDMPV